ncbi:C2H2-type zinc finger protein Ecym_2673 [Eremothecium cymbalariae DBVPG|uniref:C2H2-type domain-containing protein n=1 Tax=Eremothecium cymbalariae (strain CBS 270.75 / DBVPG 7215 / KCTC 17166 / NRRL Y-17582) TaxID=931890 RepID=G8JNV8_ERECY|nr:Hypothetical protein Ecym_2673 [Eremothecium cymbalariae DBVPG\
MFQYSENNEEFDSQNPAVDLYNMCKPITNTWPNPPAVEDSWLVSPISEEVNKSDTNYFTAFFFDYHHELQVQQMKLQQQLQQLQLLEQLIHPGHLLPAVNNQQSVSSLPEADSNNFETTGINTNAIVTNDFGQWITDGQTNSSVPTLFESSLEKDFVDDSVSQTASSASILSIPTDSSSSAAVSPRVTGRRTSVLSSNNVASNLHRYICSDCGKGFARASSLRTHRNIHTGDRPFTCPFKNCGKSFNARSNMLRHHKLHFKTDCGLYMLPNGETTSVKPSSRKLFALSKQQHQKFAALPTV